MNKKDWLAVAASCTAGIAVGAITKVPAFGLLATGTLIFIYGLLCANIQ